MIVDSSALVALIFKEPEWPSILDKLESHPRAGVATPTLVETGIVVCARVGPEGASMLRRLIVDLDLQVVPFGEHHWQAAVAAFVQYGRGRHRAALNFGDAMAYATAKLAGEPLLFVGDDFAHTDVGVA
jgi:ribonuclease VapC